MPRDVIPNYGAKDFLKLRLRVRRASIPSVTEILIIGFQNGPVPVSSARVPDRKEERREPVG
jgi:hypothetical protein